MLKRSTALFMAVLMDWTSSTLKEFLLVNRFNSGLALLSVPIMLFGRPLMMSREKKEGKQYKKLNQNNSGENEENVENNFTKASLDSSSSMFHEDSEELERLSIKMGLGSPKNQQITGDSQEGHGGHHEDGMGEVLVHQVIETIEFVLGSVSNTASYLRLWALSLAHRQLSVVFYEMLILPNLANNDNVLYSLISLVICLTIYMNATFGVLMMMDLLECFLHALRLHW